MAEAQPPSVTVWGVTKGDNRPNRTSCRLSRGRGRPPSVSSPERAALQWKGETQMGEIVYTKTGAALYVDGGWLDTSWRTCPPPDIVDVLARVNADIALLDAPVSFDGDSFEAVAFTDRTLIHFDGRWTTPNGVPAFVPETMRPLACRTFYCTPWHAGGDDQTLAAVELWALGLRDRYAEDRNAV